MDVNPFFFYTLFSAALYVGLIALSWIDIRSFRLPNILTFPLMALGLLCAYFLPFLSLKSAVIGIAIGYLGFVLIEYVFRAIYRKDGLGRGDAKLLAVGGAWCGWFGLPYIIFIASLCGLVFTQLPSQKTKLLAGQNHIPFGPFLSLGVAVVWSAQLYFSLR